MRSRCDVGAAPAALSSRGGTLAGGAGGGDPSTRSSSHLPRFTTEVRVEYEVRVRMLALPSSPARRSSGSTTRRKWFP